MSKQKKIIFSTLSTCLGLFLGFLIFSPNAYHKLLCKDSCSEDKLRGFQLNIKYQQGDYDCGQTCLAMLGYDGMEMFPDQGLCGNDLETIPHTTYAGLPPDNEELLFYKVPRLRIIKCKEKFGGNLHWIIRYQDKVYCPTAGIEQVEDYNQDCVEYICREYIVPPAN